MFVGSLSLSEVVELFEKETLLQLKSQCGGLQTLLRNHGHIFKGKLLTFLLRKSVCQCQNFK